MAGLRCRMVHQAWQTAALSAVVSSFSNVQSNPIAPSRTTATTPSPRLQWVDQIEDQLHTAQAHSMSFFSSRWIIIYEMNVVEIYIWQQLMFSLVSFVLASSDSSEFKPFIEVTHQRCQVVVCQ